MQIVLLGINQQTAPLALRERVAVGPAALPSLLAALHEHVEEALVLSTCNRVEVYAVAGHHESGAELLTRVLAASRGVDAAAIGAVAYARGHERAVRQLHRVAAGLDSLVVGETEILTQLRRAAARARTAGTLGPVLGRLVSSALSHGRRARLGAPEGEAPSVVSMALAEAERLHGPLRGRRVVVLGAGETGALAAAQVAARRPARLVIANRTAERATALAIRHGGESVAWGERQRATADADVVISCVSSPMPVLDAATLAAHRAGVEAPLVCVDLAVPRTIEPAVAALPGVAVIDLASLEAVASGGVGDRGRHLPYAEQAVDEGVARFMEWWRARAVVPTIARFRARADAVRDAELARALARLPHLSERERRVVIGLARRLVGKLLHEPTVALRDDPEGANMAVDLDRLFALGADEPHEAEREAPSRGVPAASHPACAPAHPHLAPPGGPVAPAVALLSCPEPVSSR